MPAMISPSDPPAPAAAAPILYRIEHVTAYDYSQSVSVSHHVARLRPRSGPHQELKSFQLRVHPIPGQMESDVDYFGNRLDRFSIQEAHERLEVTAVSEVEVGDPPQAALENSLAWETVRDRLSTDRSADGLEAFEFVFPSAIVPVGAEYADYAAASFLPGRPLLEAALDLTHRIHRDRKSVV